MSEVIVEALGIRKSFDSLEVLKGVDFQANKGEIVSIMGASGAGKSTLLQILGTLSRPDEGSLRIGGSLVFAEGDAFKCKGALLSQNQLSAFRGRNIGFVFQAHHLLPEFTALENVMIPALIAGIPQSKAREAALSLLRRVGLSEREAHKPSQLSGGEAQRVAIARALINEPSVVFADEPTGNLDSATKEEIHQLIFALRESLGQTFVIVTHDPTLASLCDRQLFMRDGRFEG